MPLIDINNPDVIKFLIENYDKTARLRMKWNQLNSEKLKKAASFGRAEKGYCESDVAREKLIAGLATITRDHKEAGYNRRRKPLRDGAHINGSDDLKKGHSIPEVGLGDPIEDPRLARPDTDLTMDPLMRPGDPKQKQIIYDALPMYGRAAYLKSRNKMLPEKKYYFSECSEWDYGWRLGDSFFNRNAPICGRVWSLTRDVMSRTGPHPDPSHYKSSDNAGPTNCLI